MSYIRITISTGNAAFDNRESSETARILREIADRLDDAAWMIPTIDHNPLYDVNGNRVGAIKVRHGRKGGVL